MNIITFDDFCRVELRTGIIIRAEVFAKAKKPAYKIWVDFGSELGIKQSSAQITKHYDIKTLPGRMIIGCVNLAPRNIAGFMSEFLVTGFADSNGDIRLASIDGEVQAGQKLL